jgi:hypothetical protein
MIYLVAYSFSCLIKLFLCFFLFLGRFTMNFKLNALVATAVLATTMSGTASAITVGANGEMFLAAYDSVTQNSYIKALGTTATAFDGSANFLSAADANWTTFASSITNPANVKYQVLGYSVGVDSYSSLMRTTASAAPTPFTSGEWDLLDADVIGGGLNKWMTNANLGNASVTGTSSRVILASAINNSAAVLQNNWETQWLSGINTTSVLGANDGFYSVTRDQSTLRGNTGNPVIVSALLGNWNLSATGNLTYSTASAAAVPEADSAAMLLAGLGLMGFVARRRSKQA